VSKAICRWKTRAQVRDVLPTSPLCALPKSAASRRTRSLRAAIEACGLRAYQRQWPDNEFAPGEFQ
jgi:hypothetical protein